MTLHTSMRKGSTVIIILKNGQKIIDKFITPGSKAFTLEKSGRVNHKDIRSVNYYLPPK